MTRVLELVRRYGWNATSYQILQPGFEYFFVDQDACIGYVDTGRAWVAAGAPLCEPTQFPAVVAAFVDAARTRGRRVSFFAVEERFAVALTSLRSLFVGEQPTWDPGQWAATLGRVRSLREQLRRARAKGVRVRIAGPNEASNVDSASGAAVADLVRRWRAGHEMPPMGFLVDFDPQAARADHRIYLAEIESEPSSEKDTSPPRGPRSDASRTDPAVPTSTRLVGLLVASPIFARRGWLFEAILRAPDAPNGTAELLVDQAMRSAASDGDEFVTLGMAPLAGRVAPPLRWARAAGAALFDFKGLHSFKAKLRPQRWDPLYTSFPAHQGALVSLVDVLTAFARGRLLRFGFQSLLRGPRIALGLLTLALIPWTCALAAAPSDRWFPHPAVKWGWVAFDVLLIVGLIVGLTAQWRRRRPPPALARAILWAVAGDGIVTAFEAFAWNVRRITRPADLAIVTAAVLAPLLAFLVLWRSHARRL